MLKQVNLVRIILALIIVLVSSIYLPNLYWKANKYESIKTLPFYSPISKSFILMKSDVRGVEYKDLKGNTINRDDFERLTPFMNFRQLMLNGKLPDSLDGIKLVPKNISLNNVMIRVQPAAINARPVQLYPLMESASGRVRLELPEDYFRITERMEFVTSATNEINESKSELFTKELTKAGFNFPSKFIYGNPSTRKPFDQGYFVIDNKDNVFHIKMVKGKPFCKKTSIPSDLGIVFMSIAENELREFYGLIITNKSEAYLITYKNYQLIKLPVEGYNFEHDQLQVRCDLFYRMLLVNKENGLNVVITDRNYNVIDMYKESKPAKVELTAGKIASFIFPFTTSIEKETTPFINLYFEHTGVKAFVLCALMLIVSIIYLKKKNVKLKKAIPFYFIVLFTGVYGFIALLIIRDFEDDPEELKK